MIYANPVSRALSTALVLAATAQSALATPPQESTVLSPVEVMATLPVRTACPAVDQDLESALSTAWHDVGRPGTVVVEMALKGKNIVAVKALSGPMAYRQPVRRAVYRLACDGEQTATQLVRFEVTFVFPSDTATSTAAATAPRPLLVGAFSPTR